MTQSGADGCKEREFHQKASAETGVINGSLHDNQSSFPILREAAFPMKYGRKTAYVS